jgi:hypothetical protein
VQTAKVAALIKPIHAGIMQAMPCSLCRESHWTRLCPELSTPLHQEGFFKPPQGVGGGGDEEDEKLETCKSVVKAQYDGGLLNLFRINQSINGKSGVSMRT